VDRSSRRPPVRSPTSLLRRRPRDGAHSPHFRRFDAGDRSAADLIAPAAIEESRAQLAIDGQLARVLALTDYPRHVSPNWLGRLIDFEEPLDLSLHLEPLDSKEVVRMLTHRMVELQSSRMLDAKGGRIASVEREVAYEDVERLRDALERGDERVFSTSLYLRVHGRTPSELDQATARVEGTLGGMMAGARPALYEMLASTSTTARWSFSIPSGPTRRTPTRSSSPRAAPASPTPARSRPSGRCCWASSTT